MRAGERQSGKVNIQLFIRWEEAAVPICAVVFVFSEMIMCGTLGPLHERSRTVKGGRCEERAKDVKMGTELSCEEILLSNTKV